MVINTQDTNNSTGGMVINTQDTNYSTGGMVINTQGTNFSTRGMVINTQDTIFSFLTNFRLTNQNNLPCLSGPKLQCDFLFVIFEHNMEVSILLEMYFQLKCRRSLDISREIL